MRRLDIIVTPDDRLGGAPPRAGTNRAEPAAKPKPRRKPSRWRFQITPVQKLASIGILATALVVAGAVTWRSGAPQRLARSAGLLVIEATGRAGFTVSEITVSGRRRTPTDQIVGALGAKHGAPILGVDIAVVRDRLEQLPSVRAAAVERRLPGALHLSIVERQPVALWQTEGHFVLVDRDGHQIPGAIEGFEDLPLIVGDGAPRRTDELFALLATEPEMAGRVKAAIRVGNRRWTLKIDDVERGIEARLPEVDSINAWHRLAELERNHGLSSRQITMIDLRVPDRLVLKSDPQVSADRRPMSEPARED